MCANNARPTRRFGCESVSPYFRCNARVADGSTGAVGRWVAPACVSALVSDAGNASRVGYSWRYSRRGGRAERGWRWLRLRPRRGARGGVDQRVTGRILLRPGKRAGAEDASAPFSADRHWPRGRRGWNQTRALREAVRAHCRGTEQRARRDLSPVRCKSGRLAAALQKRDELGHQRVRPRLRNRVGERLMDRVRDEMHRAAVGRHGVVVADVLLGVAHGEA